LTLPQLKYTKTQGLKKELTGKSRGGNTTKIHVATDAFGNSIRVMLTSGQVHDMTVKSSIRNVIWSNFFQKLKRYRRIATRYDKLAKRFLAFIHIAFILLWLL
jgi:transposase